MTPENNTIIDLSSNTQSFTLLLDNTEYWYLLKIAPVDNPKPPSQPASYTSLSSRYNMRNSSTSAAYTSAASASFSHHLPKYQKWNNQFRKEFMRWFLSLNPLFLFIKIHKHCEITITSNIIVIMSLSVTISFL